MSGHLDALEVVREAALQAGALKAQMLQVWGGAVASTALPRMCMCVCEHGRRQAASSIPCPLNDRSAAFATTCVISHESDGTRARP